MQVNRMKRKWFMIGLGGMFIGIGINLFILPSHIINGGVFGISCFLQAENTENCSEIYRDLQALF